MPPKRTATKKSTPTSLSVKKTRRNPHPPPPPSLTDTPLLLPPPPSSIRSQPPAGASNRPPSLTKYPFESKSHPLYSLSENERRTYNALVKSTKVVQATLTPHEPTLRFYELYEDLKHMFTTSGLGILFTRADTPTYPELVLEFLSTFKPVGTNKVTTSWEFDIGGKTFKWSRDKIADCLEAHKGRCCVPFYTDFARKPFWNTITGLDGYYANNSPATTIKVPLWKCAHRLIAMSINPRSEGGDVYARDLDLMYALSLGVELDLVEILTSRFQDWANPNKPNSVMGGGLFITLIALEENFDLSGAKSGMTKLLNQEALVAARILEHNLTTWHHRIELPFKQQVQAEKKKQRHEQPTVDRRVEPPPPKISLRDINLKLDKVLENQQLLIDNQANLQENVRTLRKEFEIEKEWNHRARATQSDEDLIPPPA